MGLGLRVEIVDERFLNRMAITQKQSPADPAGKGQENIGRTNQCVGGYLKNVARDNLLFHIRMLNRRGTHSEIVQVRETKTDSVAIQSPNHQIKPIHNHTA